jgi:hypothetical protein
MVKKLTLQFILQFLFLSNTVLYIKFMRYTIPSGYLSKILGIHLTVCVFDKY